MIVKNLPGQAVTLHDMREGGKGPLRHNSTGVEFNAR
jgi:hypothetical protein